MFVHLKQSGELLASQGQPGDLWTPAGIVASAEKTAAVFSDRDQLGIEGLLVVSGAGNIIRGEKLKKEGIASKRADLLGRLATIQNTIVLEQALKERDVPVQIFLANTMSLTDISIPEGIDTYDVEAVAEAYDKERIVLIAGGTGEDNKTTDSAVLEYARELQSYKTDDEVLVLKGTKYDGVYDKDPAKDASARRYALISAGYMLDRYDDFPVVDRPSLHTIQTSRLSMRIYADGKHDLQSVVAGDRVGTLIVAGYEEPTVPH